ncbi:TIGR00730 family Rossman fold protein [uncultured Campylobacter sp.]|uniref:LOG family protein n=1 Tax=uncultured Campylobacter sp. TaxID=218934 RepID=UPI002613D00D|nr:TIGR00730 family Rossman fold protein [uncultured Campylobacter sp.]
MDLKQILKEIRNTKIAMNLPKKSVTIFGSARLKEDSPYFEKAYLLAKRLADAGYTIVTGGGGGIMLASNKGAFSSNKEQSVGFNIILPREQKVNDYVTTSLLFSRLEIRKVALIEKSSHFVVFPGGYGTLDELFEILVLVQTKLKKADIYLYGTAFFSPLVDFIKNSLLEERVISKEDLNLFCLTDEIDEIFNGIVNGSQKS